LVVAYELGAYNLVDRATLRQLSRRFPLEILVEGDARLLNEYGVTTLAGSAARRVNQRDGESFAAWLVSRPARELIAGYLIEGERAFRLPGEAR
jgi:tungstate transport system substrate-binding protein